MQVVLIVSIIVGGSLLALVLIGSIILMAIKIIKEGVSHKGKKFRDEEARTIQEIFQGLSRMEDRVEALETIILKRERKDRPL